MCVHFLILNVAMTVQFRLGTSDIYKLIFYHKHLADVKECLLHHPCYQCSLFGCI